MQAAPRSHAIAQPAEGLKALYCLPLAPFAFQQPALKKMRIVKSIRLDTVMEMFFSSHTGSGQVSIKGAAKALGLTAGHDLALLKFLAEQPSFDEYSLRIQLRNSDFSLMAPERPAAQNQEADRILGPFLSPLSQRLFNSDNTTLNFSRLLERLYKDGASLQQVAQFTQHLGCDIQTIINFIEDYADIVLSLAYYRDCLEKMTPAIDDVLRSVRDLRASYQARHDKLLRATLDLVEAATNEMIAGVTGRIESFERSTCGAWSAMTADGLARIPGQFRDYQAMIGAIICALAVKMGRWMDLFPNAGGGSPARRISLIMSEMRQGMEHIHGLLGAAPALAVAS